MELIQVDESSPLVVATWVLAAVQPDGLQFRSKDQHIELGVIEE